MAATIRNFVGRGRATTFRQKPVFPNNGGEPEPHRARLSTSGGIRGSHVRVVNPAAAPAGLARRRGGLGMGGI